MKQFLSLIAIALMLVLFSCSGKKKDTVKYEYEERVAQLSPELQERLGDWAEEGAVCYGILVLLDGEGTIQEGAAIKAKIIRIKNDSIKMKSLVDLKLREVEGCDKMGISRGETWWETEGDIFLTEEEAGEYLEEVLVKVAG